MTLSMEKVGLELDPPSNQILTSTSIGLTNCGDIPRFNVVSISYHSGPDIQDPDISSMFVRQCNAFGAVGHHFRCMLDLSSG